MGKITLDEVKEKAVDLAQSGIAKSAQVTEMAKLQINSATEHDTMKKLFIEIGKHYYEANGENPDPAYAEAIEKINKSKDKIKANNLRIKELRNPDIIMTEEGMPDGTIPVEADFEDITKEEE